MNIRDTTEADLASILKLNNSNAPAVSTLDVQSLKNLIHQSKHAWTIEGSHDEDVAGFCIILPPGIEYASDNYGWIENHYSQFEYLDRVVIDERYRNRGLGDKLYKHWFATADTNKLLLEVNVKPMNEGSIRFHERLGFQNVGEQDTENGGKRVRYMLKAIS